MASQFVYDANTTRVLLNGKEFHLVQSLRLTQNNNLTEVSGIGDAKPWEFAVGLVQHRFTLNGFFLRQNEPFNGIVPRNADEAMSFGPINIEIFDKVTGQRLRRLEEAKCSDGEFSMDAHRVYMKGVTFMARDAE